MSHFNRNRGGFDDSQRHKIGSALALRLDEASISALVQMGHGNSKQNTRASAMRIADQIDRKNMDGPSWPLDILENMVYVDTEGVD